jgi:chemotaxis methyl-accepting protein methylase
MQPCRAAAEPDDLELPVRAADSELLRFAMRRLHTLFTIYAVTCPVPLPAPGLIITPEIRNQCQCYLPIDNVASVFYRLYRSALTYPPILSSTPFHNAMSWADVFVILPPDMQISANPARLLEALLADRTLLTEFLFASFLPARFYNGFERYPRQQEFIRRWLTDRSMKKVRCLDAACGTGEGTYDLARLLFERGFSPEEAYIDGWTLEPLEVWSAATGRFPHDRQREADFQKNTSWLFEREFHSSIHFRCADLLIRTNEEPFDLIICNGLLGGPILHEKEQLNLAIGNLAGLLAPNGIMLAADSFHGGWKQQCPQSELRALFEKNGLNPFEAGEGIGGLKSDQ